MKRRHDGDGSAQETGSRQHNAAIRDEESHFQMQGGREAAVPPSQGVLGRIEGNHFLQQNLRQHESAAVGSQAASQVPGELRASNNLIGSPQQASPSSNFSIVQPYGHQHQQSPTTSGGYSNASALSLPSALSQMPSRATPCLDPFLLQQANSLQQQYESSLFEARLRARQPQQQYESSLIEARLRAQQPQQLHNLFPGAAQNLPFQGNNDLSDFLRAHPFALSELRSGIRQSALANISERGSSNQSSAFSALTLLSQPNRLIQFNDTTSQSFLQQPQNNAHDAQALTMQSHDISQQQRNTYSSAAAVAAQINPNPYPNNTRNNSPPTTTRLTNDRCKLVYVPDDDYQINPYQRFARQQLEYFEADDLDVKTGAQGRNKPVALGQVGIRCIHCAALPPKAKARAAAYFPSRLDVTYQAAQNIVNDHLPKLCESIPESIRNKLIQLDHKRSKVGGGKQYWKEKAMERGVVDTQGGGLRFRESGRC